MPQSSNLRHEERRRFGIPLPTKNMCSTPNTLLFSRIRHLEQRPPSAVVPPLAGGTKVKLKSNLRSFCRVVDGRLNRSQCIALRSLVCHAWLPTEIVSTLWRWRWMAKCCHAGKRGRFTTESLTTTHTCPDRNLAFNQIVSITMTEECTTRFQVGRRNNNRNPTFCRWPKIGLDFSVLRLSTSLLMGFFCQLQQQPYLCALIHNKLYH